jgi:hypothetical protein
MVSLMAVSSLEKTVKRVGSLEVYIWSGYVIAEPFLICVLEPSVKIGTVCDWFSHTCLWSWR